MHLLAMLSTRREGFRPDRGTLSQREDNFIDSSVTILIRKDWDLKKLYIPKGYGKKQSM